jgi:hypothetical protein
MHAPGLVQLYSNYQQGVPLLGVSCCPLFAPGVCEWSLLATLETAAAAAAAAGAGPWKSLWVSCGCDPRDSEDARRYQILQYRLPTEW